VTTSARLSCEQILALPPAITLAELGRVLDVSEPTVRASHRRGELGAMGIKVVRIGAQFRVITSTVWQFLGLEPRASPAPSPGEDAGQDGPSARRVRFLEPVRAADGD
jgi:hypothetical protein